VVATVLNGLGIADWEQLSDPPGEHFEVVDGRVTTNAAPKPVHQGVIRLFVNALNASCPPGLHAEGDIEWRVVVSETVTQALRPDVLVTRIAELKGATAVMATPTLVAEVLSPANRRPDFDAKLTVYLRHGVGYLVLVDVNQDETTVGIRWLRPKDGRWAEIAAAAGTNTLVVDEPFHFELVPNNLLPW
jgi:Uma2 family endonuclease